MGHSELTEATDHDCASLFRSQCVNSMPNPKTKKSFASRFKVIAVVDTLDHNRTWSKRDIEKLVGMFYNYGDWLNR